MFQFSNTDSLKKHLNDHVLTPSESYSWGIVWKGEIQFLEESDNGDNTCYRMRVELFDDMAGEHSLALSDLMNRYLTTANDLFTQSQRLGWRVQALRVAACINSSGVVGVFETGASTTIVKTVFIPGFGTADGTLQSQKADSSPHDRVSASGFNSRGSAMRGADSRGRQSDHRDSRRGGIQHRMRNRRAAAWNSDQRVYYLVFRPAIQFLRRLQLGSNACSRDVALLKSVLPMMSQLKINKWLELRSTEVNGG